MKQLILFSQCLVIVEAMAAIAGFITWKKWKHSYLKWFPVYLSIITTLEICYRILELKKEIAESSYVYAIGIPLEILFINWFFYHTLEKKFRKLIIVGCILYGVAWVLENSLLNNKIYYFQSISYTTGNLFILIYVILFFIELTGSERIMHFRRLTEFWIVCGLMLFYVGSFPFYGLYNELAKDMSLFVPVAWAATAFNYGMYLLFTIGFIWGKPR